MTNILYLTNYLYALYFNFFQLKLLWAIDFVMNSSVCVHTSYLYALDKYLVGKKWVNFVRVTKYFYQINIFTKLFLGFLPGIQVYFL